MTVAALSSVAAFVVTLALIWPLRQLALRLGILDDPGPRKIHTSPIPYLGGLAMLGGLGTALLWLHPERWPVVVLLASIAAIGLVDDVRFLPVWVKLVGEATVAGAAVALGFTWNVSDSAGLNAAFSILWIVGLTNSFNLLDNMDGLASTVAAASLVVVAALVHSTAIFAAPLAGAAVAFMLVNWPPAKMYMGDTGSLMLGFGVGLCTIMAAGSRQGLHSVVLLMIPVAVALFDTSLVIVSRLATGRHIQLGGKDHFSHRLRMLGWSQYQVLGAGAAGCVAAWAAAVLALRYPLVEAWLAVPIVFAFATAWAALFRINPYASTVQPTLEVQHVHGV